LSNNKEYKLSIAVVHNNKTVYFKGIDVLTQVVVFSVTQTYTDNSRFLQRLSILALSKTGNIASAIIY